MPERVMVYLKRSVAHVSGARLVEELEQADLMTLAESLELPEGEEAAVDAMWEVFSLTPEGATDIDGIELTFHREHRPVQVRRGPPLEGELEELLESLEGQDGADRVRTHLEATTEIVEFEMGIPGSHHLGATISEVLAFFLAEQGDGIVLFYHREFAAPDDRGNALFRFEN